MKTHLSLQAIPCERGHLGQGLVTCRPVKDQVLIPEALTGKASVPRYPAWQVKSRALTINCLPAPGPGWPGPTELVRLASDGSTAPNRWPRAAPIRGCKVNQLSTDPTLRGALLWPY